MIYKICQWLYKKLRPKFEPQIPESLIPVFVGHDLGKMRFYGQKFNITQVDEALLAHSRWLRVIQAEEELSFVQRMTIKNQLTQFGLLESGEYKNGRPGDEFWRDKKLQQPVPEPKPDAVTDWQQLEKDVTEDLTGAGVFSNTLHQKE